MTFRRISMMIAAATLMSAAAGGAWAADKARPMDFTVRSEPLALAPNSGRTLKWDASKGHFGFTLEMQQPDERPLVPNDIQAGAYFRITPSIRVGGSVALGEQDLTPRANQARPATTPKVRLESTFRF
ncbi:NtrZ family periplasmic regulatory protein [Phenylobacterium sp.]|uniref:NtrZ family periplasmic regulatory protein n=1 Tax=Phenylobacterium sp. TaxID=1871053 RepID=UPI0025F1F413|nr:hypothetical protein [Phenylobacterium sp.]